MVQRNRENDRQEGRPSESKLIYLPFIVLNTTRDTIVDCSIASDKTEFLFHFDQPFEIHDDIEILKRLGLAYGLEKDDVQPESREHIRNCLPPALRDYADQIIDGTLTANVISHPPPQKSMAISTQMQIPMDVKAPVIRPINSAVRTIIPTNHRGVRNVIRPVSLDCVLITIYLYPFREPLAVQPIDIRVEVLVSPTQSRHRVCIDPRFNNTITPYQMVVCYLGSDLFR